MPLFGRRLFRINEEDTPDDSGETYTIEHTGEQYHSKTLYDKLQKVYQLERWTCECTWRAGLTHKDGYQSESDIRKTLSTVVPSYFNKPIFEIIYHNVKPLEKLAEEVSIILGQSFVLNEPVQFKKKKDNTAIKGIIELIEDNDDPKKRSSERVSIQAKPPSDKQMKNVKYSVRLTDEDRVVPNVLPTELQRCTLIPNREKLKTFIRAYAIRLGNRIDSPWVFYDQSNKDTYELKDRIASDIIEKFHKSTIVTLDEILREQERIARKQAEEQAAALAEDNKTKEINNNMSIPNGHSDDVKIVFSDDEKKPKTSPKAKVKSSPTKKASTPSTKQTKSSSKGKKQLTLHDMKFTNNSANHNELLEKTSLKTYDVIIPHSLLQKLDKTRRERGIDSRYFHRLILNCARTLNDKQRLRLPDEYRSLIQMKYDELELKRRLSQMTDEEKKLFLQSKRLEQKPIEDTDCTFLKDLPMPKQLQTTLDVSSDSIGNLLMISTFLTSCHSLFYLSLNDEISKSTQVYLRSFKLDSLLQTSTHLFTNYFLEILQILMKLLFKEDENRSNESDNQDDDDEEAPAAENDKIENPNEKKNKEKNGKNLNDSNNNEQMDIEEIYSIQLSDIPLTSYTCQELTRLYLLKEKDEANQVILDKLATCETTDLQISDQINLLVLLVNTITTDNELMADYFEHLTRILSEASRERNQLLSERRKAQEEESKQKKLQLQNGENEKVSSKKQSKPLIPAKSSNGTANDENEQTTPMIIDENGDFDNDNDDDLKTVLQRRRQMVALSKELKEKREIEAQKLQIKQKRQLAIQKAEQIYQEALINLQYGFRIKPLGYDRHYNRYWFFRGYPGVFVEKGWIGPNVNYFVELTSEEIPLLTTNEKVIPKDESNQWFVYDDENLIQQLLHTLNDRGIREHNLSLNLKKAMPYIHAEFEQMKKSKNSLDQQDENSEFLTDMISSFKTELEDIESRLRLGSLGGFIINDNLVEWQTKLKQATERHELAEVLIQLQQTVAEKYASGIFNSSDKKSLQIWFNDCRTCKTYPRLYVLMLVFENCITWNKSTVGLKCKVCRKKQKDESIIVCDQCCYGYHPECLRGCNDPCLKNSANDLWFCPACRPTSKRRVRQDKKVDYQENDIYDNDMDVDTDSSSNESSSNDEQISNSDENNEDDACQICGGENDLIQCTQCQSCYHCQCHEPPLRCPPRSTTWLCNNCRNGITNETNNRSKSSKKVAKTKQKTSAKPQKQNTTRRSTRKNYREVDEEESDDEEKATGKRRSKRLRRSDPSPTKQNENNQRKSRRARVSKSSSSSSSASSNNDDDDGDNNDAMETNHDEETDSDENEHLTSDSPSSN
ncbi:unnamed protein product [Adineta ricciae]|uniref:Uncharacterized protein n=1 Tax=Adineta ricciae TaxID=249248 RepID=A0A814JT88_ADIRI|nr:unnamed protein product [Adineta ricciae]